VDQIVWLPSIVLGLLMVGVYLVGCWRGTRRFELGVMVNVMLCSGGVVGGSLLVASVFVATLKASLSSLWLYVVIGGLSVVAVSARALYRDVVARDQSRGPPPQA